MYNIIYNNSIIETTPLPDYIVWDNMFNSYVGATDRDGTHVMVHEGEEQKVYALNEVQIVRV